MIGRTLMFACLVSAAVVLWASPASADNCSSPLDCEQTAGYTSVIAVVGGVAAVAAAAAAAIAATEEEDDPEDGQEVVPEIIVIQVNPGDIDVSTDSPALVRITAWRVVGDAAPVQAPDVPLSIQAPGASGLRLTPPSGAGDITVTVELVGDPAENVVVLTASGTAKGTTATAQVTVHIEAGYDLELY